MTVPSTSKEDQRSKGIEIPAALRALHTKQLLRLKAKYYSTLFGSHQPVTHEVMNNWAHKPSIYDPFPEPTTFTAEQLMALLNERGHVPSKASRKKKRQTRAKRSKKGRRNR